ncbi:MAG: lipoprotein precursor [uncultured bacterium]|nr:MAG: lipoprotein precursor [uncultured bacterium]
MDPSLEKLLAFVEEVKLFWTELVSFLYSFVLRHFLRFEYIKRLFVTVLYRQRGKMARRFIHSGMASLAAVGVIIAPVVAQEFPGTNIDPWEIPSPSSVVTAATDDPTISTSISEKLRDKIIDYKVQEGDTLSSIAEKFDVSVDTIRWQNNLQSRDQIKLGQVLEVLPVTGVVHKVKKGDTVYSIAKKYDSAAQAVVDFPYNAFVNDETFELAIGQTIIVPDGVIPEAFLGSPVARVKQITPDAGTVVASGTFVWPTSGTISQRFAWYHKGVDIANKAAPAILAADAGTVIVAGWPDNYGYGNRVIIDHNNGYKTLYGHMSRIYVVAGQTVSRGAAIGQMGSTGRSTGTHLHFEIIYAGTYLNPLSILQ